MTWALLCLFLACLLLLPMLGTYLALVTYFGSKECGHGSRWPHG